MAFDFTQDPMDEEVLSRACALDEADLHAQYVELPGIVSFYGRLFALALRDEATADEDAELAAAQAADVLRAQLGPKATETAIKQKVSDQLAVQRARKLARDAHYTKNRLRQHLDALSVKKEMLVSLGAHVREEMRSLGDGVRR